MFKCSPEKFFACWVKNYVKYVDMDSEGTWAALNLYSASCSFADDPETFRTMRADGFCHCDSKC